MKVYALKDYPYYKKHLFAIFIIQILNGLFQYVLLFVTPPVTKAAFSAAVDAYNKASSEYSYGGKGLKAAYENSYTVLLTMLDDLLDYVNHLPNLTSEMIGFSGFHENNVIGGGVNPLLQPILKLLKKCGGGVMEMEYHGVNGAEYYGMFIVVGGALPEGTTFIDGVLVLPEGTNPTIIHNFSKQRIKRFSNLKAGIIYYLYCYAGNTVTVSPLSVGTDFVFSNN